jgi:S1-C subfamily serine protease
VRMGIVRALGPAWHSLGGGRIDHRISLDLTISSAEEGGPVLDASGGLPGMSTAGLRRGDQGEKPYCRTGECSRAIERCLTMFAPVASSLSARMRAPFPAF